jgi:hypothetical protein
MPEPDDDDAIISPDLLAALMNYKPEPANVKPREDRMVGSDSAEKPPTQ